MKFANIFYNFITFKIHTTKIFAHVLIIKQNMRYINLLLYEKYRSEKILSSVG